jgi:alpha-N-acetylglucosaminidase
LCDVARQVLAGLSSQYHHQIDEAFRAGDRVKLEELSGKMLGLIRDMDRLAGTRREWLLGCWLADARSWGATSREKDLCECNARELLTTWTRYDNITDYACRQWNGLLGDFYYHRWDMWFQAMKDSIATGKSFNDTATRFQKYAADASQPATGD